MPERVEIREMPAITLDDVVITKQRFAVIGIDATVNEYILGCYFMKCIAETYQDMVKKSLKKGDSIMSWSESYKKYLEMSIP